MAKDERIKMNRLKQVLAEKDISQTDLAKMVGKNAQTISRICNNTHQPTIKFLREMAVALNVNVQELLVPTPIQEEK